MCSADTICWSQWYWKTFQMLFTPNSLPSCSVICSLFKSLFPWLLRILFSLFDRSCFTLYVTAAIFFTVAWLSDVFAGLYLSDVFAGLYLSRKFLCLARQTSRWQRSACTSWSITPTILRFTLFVFNTSFTTNEVLLVRSNNHRVLFISMLTNTCIVDNFVFKHISNDLCLIFLYKALLLRMR